MLDLASAISTASTSVRKNGQSRYRRAQQPQVGRPVERGWRSDVPTPYQAGTGTRACVHANTHGIARSDSQADRIRPARRPRAELQQRQLRHAA